MKLMLNTRKPGNYAFYDPKTGLHLTLGSPVGFTDGTSKYIERGLKTKAILDVTNGSEQPKAPQPKAEEKPAVQAPNKAEEVQTPVEEPKAEEKKTEAPAEKPAAPKKRGRASKKSEE